MQRTLKRELKVPEIAECQAIEVPFTIWGLGGHSAHYVGGCFLGSCFCEGSSFAQGSFLELLTMGVLDHLVAGQHQFPFLRGSKPAGFNWPGRWRVKLSQSLAMPARVIPCRRLRKESARSKELGSSTWVLDLDRRLLMCNSLLWWETGWFGLVGRFPFTGRFLCWVGLVTPFWGWVDAKWVAKIWVCMHLWG